MRSMTRWTSRLALLAALTLAASGCYWPQVGAGPDRRSFNAAERELTIQNVEGLQRQWTVELPSGSSAPVVGPDGVYVTSDFNVYAFGRTWGDARWSHAIDPAAPAWSRSLGTPVLWRGGSEVLVPSSRYAGGGWVDYEVRRYGAATGDVRPSVGPGGTVLTARGDRLANLSNFALGSGGDVFWFVGVTDHGTGAGWGGLFPGGGGQPTLGETMLYVASGSAVHAYDTAEPCEPLPDTGDIDACVPTWQVPVDGSAHPVVIGDGGTVYVGTRTGTLYALDATTGATKWSAAVGSPIASSPALADGVLYVPTDSGSLAVLPATGCGAATCPVSWRGTTAGATSTQPAVAGGVVYVGSVDGRVSALPAAGCGAATCTPVWTATTGQPGEAGRVRGLAIAQGSLYVGRADGLTRYGGLS